MNCGWKIMCFNGLETIKMSHPPEALNNGRFTRTSFRALREHSLRRLEARQRRGEPARGTRRKLVMRFAPVDRAELQRLPDVIPRLACGRAGPGAWRVSDSPGRRG